MLKLLFVKMMKLRNERGSKNIEENYMGQTGVVSVGPMLALCSSAVHSCAWLHNVCNGGYPFSFCTLLLYLHLFITMHEEYEGDIPLQFWRKYDNTTRNYAILCTFKIYHKRLCIILNYGYILL